MTRALIILALGGVVASSLATAHSRPPLLIDSAPSPAPLDADG